jgi:hypothetical protein
LVAFAVMSAARKTNCGRERSTQKKAALSAEKPEHALR